MSQFDPNKKTVLLLKSLQIRALDADFSDIRAYPPKDYAGIILLRPHRQSEPQIWRAFERNRAWHRHNECPATYLFHYFVELYRCLLCGICFRYPRSMPTSYQKDLCCIGITFFDTSHSFNGIWYFYPIDR